MLLAKLNHADVVVKELFNASVEVTSRPPDARSHYPAPRHAHLQYRRAFEAEMAAVVAAAHPNVVRMLGVCEHDGRLLLVMERADGRYAPADLDWPDGLS